MLKLLTFIAVLTLFTAVTSGLLVRECRSAEEEEEWQARVNPHSFRGELCSMCHSEQPPLLLKDQVTTCVRCHPGNIGNHPVTRHPMGLMPRMKIPASLPLTEEGEMVCSTCHEPHGRTPHPRLLRIEYLKLCASCHKGY
ncbi:MAG TPA: hypothetical protein DDW94_10235 [Deltaproteobacteria bacterium]|nr:MAG: hypothetical protein A2Z79_00410 [Deltaproteobacteria bacterium GWA2_55_82]OGQ64846.1 MAG: hypothetical protein A3I81_04510 [Deltaproteobacteria bacterium RIFCSPLOWO2_02_FULL_55_12]OIJ73912.1 MAG: hypothetical protein A2V21_306315 [Deltaproteobacteria bacterium GWC2_55_46]HBG47350.1 hypothetical protein [Deltaproteobacteria bacterium]HCY09905.1 hypothetical protein [Deltaproteobacteria bacterium]